MVDINLPWTCETADRIKIDIARIVLISSPSLLLYSLYKGFMTNELSILFPLGLFYLIIVGGFSWLYLDLHDVAPEIHFKCKSKVNEVDNQ